jgi:hypothetical protein
VQKCQHRALNALASGCAAILCADHFQYVAAVEGVGRTLSSTCITIAAAAAAAAAANAVVDAECIITVLEPH